MYKWMYPFINYSCILSYDGCCHCFVCVFLHIVNVVIHLTLKLRWCIALLNNMVSPAVKNFYFISSPISVSPSLNSLIKVEHFKNVSMFQQQESVFQHALMNSLWGI